MKRGLLTVVGALAISGAIAWWYTAAPGVDFEGEEAWVDARIQSLQFTDSERTYEEVRWTHDVQEAFSLAAEHNRPVLMYSNDGPLGRC